jgi:FkbM family methyltransferase
MNWGPGMQYSDYEKLDPHVSVDSPAGPVQFSTPNSAAAWRVSTLFTKEPDTIDWIAEFEPGSVLVDIGANVGMYTIWSAKTRGTTVFAFEPESQNFAILNRNILRNAVDDRVTAYCASVSDTTGFGRLALSQFMPGGSAHQFADSKEASPKGAVFLQGSYSTTLDTLVAEGVVPIPHYVKIDVDGIEPQIVRGARETFSQLGVKSVLIEVDTRIEDHWNMVDLMLELGFDYSQEQVERAQRKDGPFKGVGNYVFRR